ncbi:MAG: hypothetical protein M8357_12915 [Desulfobulbaceae bacterium]|nr:hypothetical protein [Desulfobulbaceae bacterium]
MNISSMAHAEIDLWDWGINIDGTTYCLEGPCDYDFFAAGSLNSLADLPSSIDYSNFDLSDYGSPNTGLGVLAISITGTGEHSVSVYLNYDIDSSINGYVNETGSRMGLPVPGLSWEIDEIGWGLLESPGTAGIPYLGNIFDNFIDSGLQTPPRSQLDNRIFYNDFSGQGLEPPIEDAALAKSWDFDLCEGETAIITFTAGTVEPASGFYLVQQDPDSGTNVYLTSNIVFDSTCSGTVDCLGIPHGTAVEDNCGVCDDDSTNDCTQDCADVWGGDAVVDDCGVCDADPANDCSQKSFPWTMYLNIIVNSAETRR